MLTKYKLIPIAAAAVLLAGCASVPTGPQVMVMPGAGKTYDQFRQDEAVCQNYAFQATGNATRAANESGVNSAAVGTVVGAAAGALIGAASGGNAGSGAAIGAGSGLLIGGASGSNQAMAGGYGAQRRYDNVYMQCMYTKGNQVPVRGDMQPSRSRMPPPPPAGYSPQQGATPPSGYGAPPDYGPPPGYRQ
ncbi:MAG TPA: glycine zipper family protein [Herbaspirillum sp.]|jgi:uncharacterized protein YcfJ